MWGRKTAEKAKYGRERHHALCLRMKAIADEELQNRFELKKESSDIANLFLFVIAAAPDAPTATCYNALSCSPFVEMRATDQPHNNTPFGAMESIFAAKLKISAALKWLHQSDLFPLVLFKGNGRGEMHLDNA